MQPYLLSSITYSKHIKYIQIHLYMKNMLMKSLFVHYIYISNYIKWGLRTFRETTRAKRLGAKRTSHETSSYR